MRYYLTLLSCFCLANIFAQTNPAINKFINTDGFENASIGISIKDLSGNDLASYNQSSSLIPASTLKILTTATAIELFGENFQFTTELSIDKNNPQHLIVHGYGDPTLGSEHFFQNTSAFLNKWTDEIKKNINTLSPIDITIVDDFFGYNGVSPKWIEEDMGNYFAAGTYGISLFDNTYRLYLNSMNVDAAPEIIKTAPNMKDIIFTNHLTVNYENKDNAYIYGEPLSNYRRLTGNIPAKRTSFVIKGDFPDPGMILAETLVNTLAQNGFKINSFETNRQHYFKQIYSAYNTSSYDEVPFYKHKSPTLKNIIRIINEKSNNHYSEHLIRTIGRLSNPDIYSDPLIEGISKAKDFWSSIGFNTDGVILYDGCGLAPSNSINTEILCDLLIHMQTKSKHKDAFFASLPKAGQEGTVRNFLKGTRLQGKIFVKSGSIANVQSFAGYYINGDKKYAFSIMVNNYNSPRKQVVRAIESLLLEVF